MIIKLSSLTGDYKLIAFTLKTQSKISLNYKSQIFIWKLRNIFAYLDLYMILLYFISERSKGIRCLDLTENLLVRSSQRLIPKSVCAVAWSSPRLGGMITNSKFLPDLM